MIGDGRTVPDGFVRSTDVCVIGAGAAGITIALELEGSGLDVVVVEGGGLEAEAASTALHEGEVAGSPFGAPGPPVPLTEVRLRYLGGTTNHWAGYCRPQEPHVLEARPHRPRSGWPIPAEELQRWYEHVAPRFEIDTLAFDAATWDRELGTGPPLLDDSGGYPTLVNQIRPVRFGTVFRPDLEAAVDVEVLLHSNATEILVDEGTDAVRGVAVAVLDGPRFTVAARAVVVALGGIENPRLLLASRSVRTAGIGNDRDLVGRFFCEHPQCDLALAVLDRTPDELGLYRQTALGSNPYYSVSGAMVADAASIDGEGLLAFEAGLVPLPYPDQPQGGGLAAAEVARVAELTGAGPAQSICVVRGIGEQELNPDSRVRVSTELDPLGVPRLEVDWRFLDIDRVSMLTHLRRLGREIGRRGLGRVQIVAGTLQPADDPGSDGGYLSTFVVDPGGVDPDAFPLAHGCHHMCTTRMATSRSDGVVDTDCRVHGTANLYVAGASVFPVSGSAPPTFTVVALAARLADHLRRTVAR